ncbi:hypothetical protein [Yoonia sp. BS5-3]|uniref:Lysozyme inhibitor LprI N-terminal domain-containing protein n=1 Tax=Yoonia phaeophyticola TaxID=3137369 RepID=A0ABZ2V3T9_9RHOB
MAQASTRIYTLIGLLHIFNPTLVAAQVTDACPDTANLLMHCTFDDGARQMALCQSDKVVSYSFGVDLDRPEISLSSTITDLQNVPYNRVTADNFEQIRFHNGDTSYEIYAYETIYSSPTGAEHHTEGGIRVKYPGGSETVLVCDDTTVTPGTPRDGIGQIPAQATAEGIRLISDCADSNDDINACLGIARDVDIKEHGCTPGQDWTDCWAHESNVWRSVLAAQEAETIARLSQIVDNDDIASISKAQEIWHEGHRLDCRLAGTLPFAADAGNARCIAERNAARVTFLQSVIGFAEFDG